MSLTVLCGPFQPTLEEAFLKRLDELAPDPSRPVAVVAPSQRLLRRLERLIALERGEGRAVLGLRFHNFYTLALEAFESAGYSRTDVITDELFYDRLVDEILTEHLATGGRRLSRGLAAAFRNSVTDLMEANVDPAQFAEHFGEVFTGDGERERLLDLLKVQAKFIDRLAQTKVLPLYGVAQEATNLVRTRRAEALGRYSEILYYGFYDLNGTDADFFQAVAAAHPTTLFCPLRPGHPAYAFAERFYQLKLHGGGRAPMVLPARSEERALGPALDAVFVPGAEAAPPNPEALTVMNVSGLRDEAWRVAKEILTLTERRENPMRFDEIGVVARDLTPYRAALVEVFRENGVPLSLSLGESLLRYPLAKLALNLLSLRRRDYPVDPVMDLITSPYFQIGRHPGRNKGPWLRAHWTRLIERLGIHSGWLQWRGKLARRATEDFELRPELVAEGQLGYVIPKEDTAALWDFLRDLHEQLDPRRAFASWAEMAAFARKLLEENFIKPEEGRDALAWERCLASLDAMKNFDRLSTPPTWDGFLDAVEEKFRASALETPEENAGVRVLNVMDARGQSFRALFLLGLKEGAFPRQVREDPLLRDAQRGFLQQPGGYWILPKLAGYDEEKLLFHLMISAAGERLYCLVPRSDDAGKAQVPSIYLRELLRACGRDLEADVEHVPRPPLAKIEALPARLLSPKEASLLMTRAGQSPVDFLESLGVDAGMIEGVHERIDALNGFGEPGNLDGITGRPGDFADDLARRGLSPSPLDRYASCPFKYFASHVLSLGDVEEPSERGELLPRVRGNLYHRILQNFHERLKANGFWSKPPDAPWQAELDAAIDATFTRLDWEEMGVYPLLWTALRRQMTQHLRRFAAQDVQEVRQGGFIPTFFEENLTVPGEGPLEGALLRGRLDRLDVNPQLGRMKIIDYKTHWRWKLEPLVFGAREHQPLFYLELADRRRPAGPGVEPVGVYYYALEDSPEFSGRASTQLFHAGRWRETREALLNNAAAYLEHIREGHFLIRPDDSWGGSCEGCPFVFACRKNHGLTRFRAEKSSIRRAFDGMAVVPPDAAEPAPARGGGAKA